MPTRDFFARFWSDYHRLSLEQRARFRKAVDALIEDLEAKRPLRPGLRTSVLQGHPGIWELSWAPDGRATFEYGDPVIEGEIHIVWRRIGGHEIYLEP